MDYLKQKKQYSQQRVQSPEEINRLKSLREKIERNQRLLEPTTVELKNNQLAIYDTSFDSFDEYETFDWKRYLSSYEDLRTSDLKTKKDAWYHWKKHGKQEGRMYYKIGDVDGLSTPQNEYVNFDWEKYVSFYPDLHEITTKDSAFYHWMNHGKSEKRKYFHVNEVPDAAATTAAATTTASTSAPKKVDQITLEIIDILDNEDDENNEEKKQKQKEEEEKRKKAEMKKRKEEKRLEEEKKREEELRRIQETIPKWEENFDDTEDLNMVVEDIKTQDIQETIKTSQKLDNYSELIKNYDPEAVTYENFDWRSYVQNYKDLSSIDSKKKAWVHWESAGKKEKRVTYNLDIKDAISFIDLKLKAAQNPIKNRDDIDLKLKPIYDNYGNHYFGWKKIINQFVSLFLEEYKTKSLYFNKGTLFDEWIEKLLIWGNKIQRDQTIETLNQKDYNLVTFIHNPPYDKYYDSEYKQLVKNSVMLTDEVMLNRNLFRQLHLHKLHTRVTYLITLSNTHKEYLCKTYPFFKSRLISMYHPIEIHTAPHLNFDFDKFLDRRSIVHVGWWLRNFKTFADFAVPESFRKMIIVKNDFHESWIPFSQNLNLSNVDIYEEMDATQYENIMRSSCIFVDLEDCVANNTILECIKFNTPVITRRNPHIEEYLGFEYPLYFETNEDLIKLLDENELLAKIEKAHLHMKNMDKSHVSLETFNKKLMYELQKLERKENGSKMTWCCILNEKITMEMLEKVLLMFNNQTDNENLEIRFFTNEQVYSDIICVNSALNRFLRLLIKKTNSNLILMQDFSEKCFMEQVRENVQTDYLMFINGQDEYNNDFSIHATKFFDKYPTCDVSICSYTDDETTEKHVIKTGEMLFMSTVAEKPIFVGNVVLRHSMLSLLDLPSIDILNNVEDFVFKCIMNHFNIFSHSEKPEMIHKARQ
jgi:hypothetical protein